MAMPGQISGQPQDTGNLSIQSCQWFINSRTRNIRGGGRLKIQRKNRTAIDKKWQIPYALNNRADRVTEALQRSD
jgi:hypothetical protein